MTSSATPPDAPALALNPTDPESDLHALDRQLGDLREQLTETQRLATVGTIAAVIAHEFNNLLTPIASYCQLALGTIEQDKRDDALVHKALSKSHQHAIRAGKICSALLALVRGEGERGPVTVQALVDETLAVLARDPQKDGISLRAQIMPGLSVRGDAVQLEQVLLNLLINARQALLGTGARGSSITIRAEPHEQMARISVIDNGPGIAPQHLPRIFEPFFTTKNAPRRGEHRGSGLGLHICRQIVEKHQGTISVESTPGRGTCFTLLLPIA